MVKQESLCSHTLEMCPNCKGNCIAFSNKYMKKTEASKAEWKSIKSQLAGQRSTNTATDE